MIEKQPVLRELFVNFRNQESPRARRDYIESEIIRMIADGDLYLTEVMNQENAIMQTAGDVIFGQSISDGKDGLEAGKQNLNVFIPSEIKNHLVCIEALNTNATVKYSDGMEIANPGVTVKYIDGMRPIRGVMVGHSTKHRVEKAEYNVVDTGKTKVFLGLREAWLCLKQYGKWVAYGETAYDKEVNWRYAEIKNATHADEKTTEKKVATR